MTTIHALAYAVVAVAVYAMVYVMSPQREDFE